MLDVADQLEAGRGLGQDSVFLDGGLPPVVGFGFGLMPSDLYF